MNHKLLAAMVGDLQRGLGRVAVPEARGFRAFCTSEYFCGLDLSPAMLAIIDASEGVRPSVDDDLARRLFGCRADELPTVAPRVVAVRAGGRAGKSSRLLATKSLHAAWSVPLPDVREGEVASALVMAPTLDLATQVLGYVRGYVAGSPAMRAAVVDPMARSGTGVDDDAKIGSAQRIVLRRPLDGRQVEVVVRAATRGGTGARARTLVFAGLDEAAFFRGDDGYTVNDREIYRAAIQRIVPGGQLWIASTPWLADEGLLEEAIARDWGRHDGALCVIAPTRLLNPNWDPDRTIEASLRAEDPENAAREIDAVPIAQGSEQFYNREAIRRAFELPTPEGRPDAVGAGADAGFVRDASAVAAVGRWDSPADVQATFAALAGDELLPEHGAPLRPGAVVRGWGELLGRWAGVPCAVDGHYREALREHADGARLLLVEAPVSPVGPHLETRKLLDEGRLALGGLPEQVRERLRAQLSSVRRRALPGGGMQIVLPRARGAGGGGHCDLVAALVLAVWQAMQAPSAAASEWRSMGERRFSGAVGGRRGRW